MSDETVHLVEDITRLTRLQEANRAAYQKHPKLYPYLLSCYVRLFDRPLMGLVKKYGNHTPYFRAYSRKERARCIRDILVWDYVYGYLPVEYLEYDFPNKTEEERLSYLSLMSMSQQIVANTTKEAADRFFDKDKWTLSQMLLPVFHRDVACITPDGAHDADFLAFAKKHPSFLVKPWDGCGGHGIRKFQVTPGHEEAALAELKKEAPVFLEEILKQSKELSYMNASSVNTLRVATFIGGGQFEIGYIMLRIGRKDSLVDNMSSGGIAIGVDPDTFKTYGKLYVNSRMQEDTRHPDTGAKLGDYALPDPEGFMALLTQAISLLPKGTCYCGWDIAHSESGWCVIECNDTGTFDRALFSGKGEAAYFKSRIEKYAALNR